MLLLCKFAIQELFYWVLLQSPIEVKIVPFQMSKYESLRVKTVFNLGFYFISYDQFYIQG